MHVRGGSIIKSYDWKAEKKRPLGWIKHRWQDNIKTHLKDKVSVRIEFLWLRTDISEGYCKNGNSRVPQTARLFVISSWTRNLLQSTACRPQTMLLFIVLFRLFITVKHAGISKGKCGNSHLWPLPPIKCQNIKQENEVHELKSSWTVLLTRDKFYRQGSRLQYRNKHNRATALLLHKDTLPLTITAAWRIYP
jgi:hypothetical protein